MVYHDLTMLRQFILLGQLKLQNKPVLALLIHDIPLRNIVEPLVAPALPWFPLYLGLQLRAQSLRLSKYAGSRPTG